MLLDTFPEEGDFTSMTGFDFAWRWTDAKYDLLPSEALKTIKPLKPLNATEIWNQERHLLDASTQSLSSRLFIVERHAARRSSAGTMDWLNHRLTPAGELVVVSFQPEEAVTTTVATFIQYWETFCYSGAYDVTIWPKSQCWGLLYDHNDLFHHGVWRLE